MPAWRAVARLVGLLCLAGVEVRASDRVPVQQARDASSLTEAKQQLDTLKAGNTAAAVTPGDATIPGVTVPELHGPNLGDPQIPAVPRPTDKSRDARAKPGRTGNWLVDAMMGPDRDVSKTGGADRPPGSHRSSPDRRAKEPQAGSATDIPGDPADPETPALGAGEGGAPAPSPRPPEPPPNPFTRYLSDWMTPQDYSLLRRTMDTPGERGAGAPASGGAPAQDASIAQTLADLGPANDRAAAPSSAASPRPPAENPYLSLWRELEARPAPAELSPAAAPVAPGSRLLEPPPPAPEPKPAVPDFVKPANDEKYFKPLKRF